MTSSIQWVAAALFAVALLHTFTAKQFERLSHRFPRHAGLFHLLGEVEMVFGFWAIVLVVAMALLAGPAPALAYAESRNYTEPLFVFVVMVVAASRPVLRTVVALVDTAARVAPVPTPLATAWPGLAAVPLFGSLVTEPAAMTIAALMLAPQIFRPAVPEHVKYLALGASSSSTSRSAARSPRTRRRRCSWWRRPGSGTAPSCSRPSAGRRRSRC